MFVIPRVRPVTIVSGEFADRDDTRWPSIVCLGIWLSLSTLGWAGIISAYSLIIS